MRVLKDTNDTNASVLDIETVAFLRRMKNERKLTEVAKLSGVSYSSITKILSGETKHPSAYHCEKILAVDGLIVQLVNKEQAKE